MQLRLESLDEAEAVDRASFEETFYALSAKIGSRLRWYRDSLSSLPQVLPSSSAHDSDHGMRVRLPKLNLSSFSSKYDK